MSLVVDASPERLLAAVDARLDGWAATLHDDVLQPLYALRLGGTRVDPALRDACLDDIAATVHRLVSDLAPPVLADFGLRAALGALAPDSEIVVDGREEMPRPVARYVYRMAQDAVAETPHPVRLTVTVETAALPAPSARALSSHDPSSHDPSSHTPSPSGPDLPVGAGGDGARGALPAPVLERPAGVEARAYPAASLPRPPHRPTV